MNQPEKLDGIRLGWVVGLIEGEGYMDERGGRPGIRVDMTDEDVVRRLHEWTGIGNVTGPYLPVGTQKKQHWRWTVTARDDAAWLIGLMAPWFGARRAAKALEILDAYAAAGPTRGTADTCGWGHDISEGSPNLRVMRDGKYDKRRCLQCAARRQREHRARWALRGVRVT